MAKEEWLISAERFIAYFDIMGFKKMIKDGNLNDLYTKFSKLIETNISANRRSRIAYYIYSDLIVVITKDSSQDSLKQLLEASIKITNDIIDFDWGMSGSIAKGRVVYDNKKHIFLGQPVVDAFLMQEEVDFYGITICDSAVEDIKRYIADAEKKKITRHLCGLLKEERLHFKSGYYSQYHLRWFDYVYNPKGPSHPYYIKQRDDNHVVEKLQSMLHVTKGKAKRYIENTLDLLS